MSSKSKKVVRADLRILHILLAHLLIDFRAFFHQMDVRSIFQQLMALCHQSSGSLTQCDQSASLTLHDDIQGNPDW